MNPLVSILLPAYNCEKYIRKTIDSLLNQTYQHFELLIINDGSTDNSLTKIKEIKNDHGSVTYLNSGDWVENLTALEYNNGEWSLYKYEDTVEIEILNEDDDIVSMDNKDLFKMLFAELNNPGLPNNPNNN